MILALLFALGGVVGLLWARWRRGAAHRVFFPYVVVAICGSLAGGFILADALGHEPSSPGDVDPVVLLAALFGAVALTGLLDYGGRAIGVSRSGRSDD